MSISPTRFRRTERLVFLLAGALGAAACTAPGRSTGNATGSGTGGETGNGGSTGGSGGAGATGSGGGVSSGTGGRLSTGGAGGNTGGTGTGGAGSSGTGGGSGGAAGSGTGSGGAPLVIPGAGQCAAPTGASVADATAAYNKWKTDLVVSDGARGFLRVRRPNSSGAVVNSSNSEGIGYGMLLAVYANDQSTFDNLWKYEQLFPDNHGLMNWYIAPDGNSVLGSGAATDADEDMAFALVMADKRWGGQGSLSTTYLAAAKTLIGLIWQYEVDASRNHVLTSGDRVRRVGHQHLVLRACLLPRLWTGRQHGVQLEDGHRHQLHGHLGHAERAERQQPERPRPRLVDAGRRADDAARDRHAALPPARFLPDAVPAGRGLLLERGAARAHLPAEAHRLLFGRRRREHGRRLRPRTARRTRSS